MKKILITGANSYIGTSFERWVQQWPDEYTVDTIDMKDGSWKEKDFSGYDVVFHVAGIAHVKETQENSSLFYKVNRDLAVQTAKIAKQNGVRQFILLSSMSVYGMDTGIINKKTVPHPITNYGKSKLEADENIIKLEDDNFKVSIIRPPMVYGKGCKGNYHTLANFAVKSPIFPFIRNERSMIYINNLTECVKIIIDNEAYGLFLPQNKDYICTSEMVRLISEINGKKIRLTKVLNPMIMILKLKFFNKVFGSLKYDEYENFNYDICDFNESIIFTEGRDF